MAAAAPVASAATRARLKAAISTQASGVRQNQRVAANKKISKQNTKSRTKVAKVQGQQRRKNTQQGAQSKIQVGQALSQQRVQTSQQMADIQTKAIQSRRRRQSVLGAGGAIAGQRSLGRATKTIASPAQPLVNPILLIMFTWAAIVILYVLITNPNPTSGFFGMLRNWISFLYSSDPMFVELPDMSHMKVNEHLGHGTTGGSTTVPPSSGNTGVQQG